MSLTGEGLVVVTIEVEVVLELEVTVAVELVGSSTKAANVESTKVDCVVGIAASSAGGSATSAHATATRITTSPSTDRTIKATQPPTASST
jgi:hypothetical protein